MAVSVQQISTTVWVVQGLMPSQSPQSVLQAAALSVGSQAIDDSNGVLWEVSYNAQSRSNIWSNYTSMSSVRGVAVTAESVNAGQVLFLDQMGLLRVASTMNLASMGRVCGISEQSVLLGHSCTFVGAGELNVPVPLSPGESAWVSTVPGAVSNVASPTGYVQSLGIVRHDGVLMVRVGGVIQRSS